MTEIKIDLKDFMALFHLNADMHMSNGSREEHIKEFDNILVRIIDKWENDLNEGQGK